MFGAAASNADVFAELDHAVRSVVDGCTVCVAAYGATGSGKTHTMLGGGGADAGVVQRALGVLFDRVDEVQKQGWECAVTAQFVEVYNDDLGDLLAAPEKGPSPAGPLPNPNLKLAVAHGDDGATTIVGAAVHPLQTAAAASALAARAARARRVGATACNAASSRSHAAFFITLRASYMPTGEAVVGSLALVDLAGSERLKASGAEGAAAREAAAINKSLSALGDAIVALGDDGRTHVPVRNAKLTWALARFLARGARVALVLAASPAAASAGETLCSLRFGAKVNATLVGAARRGVVARPV